MPDVFVSYASRDRTRVRPLVEALERRGWDVWWDGRIPIGADWEEAILAKLDEARCIVVIWSHAAVDSTWVTAREARTGLDRNVLIQARLDDVDPPGPFQRQQRAELAAWDGSPGAPEITDLVRAIEAQLGLLALTPVRLVIVTGDPQHHADLGPTANVSCRLVNATNEAVELTRLTMDVSLPDGGSHEMAWHRFYDDKGLEHEPQPWGPVTVEPDSVWQQGVQFTGMIAGVPNVWPAGTCEFQIFGWANRSPARLGANLRTTFTATVDPTTHEIMRLTRASPPEAWDTWEEEGTVTDRAVGFPLTIHDIETG